MWQSHISPNYRDPVRHCPHRFIPLSWLSFHIDWHTDKRYTFRPWLILSSCAVLSLWTIPVVTQRMPPAGRARRTFLFDPYQTISLWYCCQTSASSHNPIFVSYRIIRSHLFPNSKAILRCKALTIWSTGHAPTYPIGTPARATPDVRHYKSHQWDAILSLSSAFLGSYSHML